MRTLSFVMLVLLTLLLLMSQNSVHAFWFVNSKGELVQIKSPSVLGYRNSYRRPTLTPTTRPTIRPTATATPRPTATRTPTATTAPIATQSPSATSVPTATRQPEVTATTMPIGVQDAPTSIPIPLPTNTIAPTQPATIVTSEPSPTTQTKQLENPTSAPQSQNNNSWIGTLVDKILNSNKEVEPTAVPSSPLPTPTNKLPPPTNILRIENNNDQVGITKINENGSEQKLGDQLWLEIQSQKTEYSRNSITEISTKDIIRLGTGTNKSIIISRNNMSVKTNLPVSVDLTTNGILVETPSGMKRIVSLPDQAIKKMQSQEFITFVDATRVPELIDENGVPMYKINGTRKGKLFGIAPVTIRKEVFVSAETGNLFKENLTFFNQLLEKTSF